MSSSAQPPAEYAFWQTPGAAITVVYSLTLFHEIDFVANEGYRRIPHGGMEVAGLLFGRKKIAEIRVEAFRSVESEHAYGPSFVLSERDLEKLQTQLSTFDSDPELRGLEPVGWFVAHSRSALQMSEREVAWFDRFFPAPRSVAVLVKPERFKPTRFGFVVRMDDGQLLHSPAEEAIILPLTGRGRGAEADQSEGKPVPSLPSPAPSPSRSVAASSPEPERTVPAAVESPIPPLPQPAFHQEQAAAIPAAPSAQISETRPLALSVEPASPASLVIETPEPAAPVERTEPAGPQQVPTPFAEPVPAAAPFRAIVLPEQPPPEAQTRVVPSHGIETRPMVPPASVEQVRPPEPKHSVWSAVPPVLTDAAAGRSLNPEPQQRPIEKTTSETPLANHPRPVTHADEIWRQRVEALPLKPAPQTVTPPKPAHHVPEPTWARHRALATESRTRPRLAFVVLVAALLGCCVGYLAYLQLPSAVIPLTVKPQATGLVVSWPAAQTLHAAQATIQIGQAQPVSLSPEERAAGQVAVTADGNDIRIELVARHWPRDSRGVLRLVRGAR